MTENTTAKPVSLEDKRVVNGEGDINQLAPFKYPWAWDFFLRANKNHWTPLDITMVKDKSDYELRMTEGEKRIFENVLAYLTTADIIAMRNIGLAVMEKMTAPELQIYQARQVYEEALHCYREGTEVLTERGFVDFRHLKPDDKVAQYNKDGSIEFVNHLGITVDDFDGELIRFQSGVYFKEVTPNHRCVAFNSRSNNELEIKTAEELSPRNRDFPVAGYARGTLSEFTPMDMLRVAYQADGSIVNAGKELGDGTYCYKWHLKKGRKRERLHEIIAKLDLRYTGGEVIYVWTPVKLEKNLDFVDLTNVSSEWARAFVHELTLWDGTLSDTPRYYTTNKSCADMAQAVACLAGYRTGVHTSVTSGGAPYYTVSFVNSDKVSGRTMCKVNVPYKGKVYSVGVPSTMIIVRSAGGKVCISGNTWTYQHCIESIGLDQQEIYNRYRVVPEIHAKIKMANDILETVMDPNIDLTDRGNLKEFVKSYIFFAAIFEGTWFYNGFTPIFALQRAGLMRGTSEQLQYIMRDEILHFSFGLRVVKTLMSEEDIRVPEDEIHKMFLDAIEVEKNYAQYILPKPVRGYTSELHTRQAMYTMDRRLKALGYRPLFGIKEQPVEWLAEQANIRKEKNFFETRVTEYEVGAELTFSD